MLNTGQVISEKEYVKDLGVYMSNTADFSEHINRVTLVPGYSEYSNQEMLKLC